MPRLQNEQSQTADRQRRRHNLQRQRFLSDRLPDGKLQKGTKKRKRNNRPARKKTGEKTKRKSRKIRKG